MSTKEPYEQLEERWSKWTNSPNMVSCSSGTAALHLAIEALQLPEGSEILVPEFTMIACARAVTLAGHTPVFVDCNALLLMDMYKIRHLVSARTKAIMPVHIYGRICNREHIRDAATRYKLKIIEDCSEAHGAFCTKEYSCDARCWSFYKNKVVAGEEGGAISFEDPAAAERARSLRSLGMTKTHDFSHIPGGHNYRMSNLHASAVMDSLDKVEHNTERRHRVVEWYDKWMPDEMKMPQRTVPWVYDLRLGEHSFWKQDVIVFSLNSKGIAARHGFKPMSLQPEYFDKSYTETNAYHWSKRIIYLPIRPDMEESEVKRNVEELLLLI